MAIRVVIADDVAEMREMIVKMLDSSEMEFDIVGICNNGREAVDLLTHKTADIVLMDINMPVMNGLEATQIICDEHPNVNVIIMSVQHESEYLKKAMLAGAKAYIMKPVDMDELYDTIKTTYTRYANMEKASPVKELKHEARVIAFFSAKGGVGKSFVALNSALMIHEKMNKRVLLVDLDLQFGDISLMMNKQSELTIKEMFDDSPINNYDDILPFLYKHKEGCHMLFAPKDPESAEYISKDQVKQILETVKRYYDVIIIDTGVNYNEITLNALDLSDKIVIVTNLEVTGLKNTKQSLKVMQSLNYDANKLKLVVNMTLDKFGVTKANVQKAFAYEILAFLPEDIKLVRNSINTGVPVVASKSSSLYKPLFNVCDALLKG